MGYHKLPSWKHYWNMSDDLGVKIVQRSMARNRFDMILSCLHVNDNQTIPVNNKDKLYKLKPLIDTLNKNFKEYYHGTRQLSIDESMILFKGRSTMKQYNPLKPIKRGYKLWCLADQFGYIKQFSIYQGKNETWEAKYENCSLGERVVLALTEDERGKFKMLFFDNYFNSLTLLETLKTEKTLACGTIRSNRKGLPDNILEDKKLKRGDMDHRTSCTGITFFKWRDTKCVFLASNFHGTETTLVDRKDDKGTIHKVTAPTVINDYNKYMGGVDHADQLRASYGVHRRSKKWWHRIFWGILDIAFVNSFVVYCRISGEKPSLLDFRRDVALGLMSQTDVNCKKGSLKRSSKSPQQPSNKRRGKEPSVPNDVRLGNLGVHWPTFTEGVRARCEMCAMKQIQSRPYSKCSHCGVYLCCNDKKNCFAEYHGLDL